MASSSINKLILKNVESTHPDIEITNSEPFFLGRTRTCAIEDTLVSRKHINLYADFQKNHVVLKVLGVNASALNGNVLDTNKEYTVIEGDIIEVLPAKYRYKICFSGDENLAPKNNSPKKVSEESLKKKRRLSDSVEQLTPSKRRKWTVDIFRDGKDPFPGDPKWISYNNGQLIVFTMDKCRASSKIAAYDMDGTLITTKSGRVFPKDVDDWKIAFGTAASTLKKQIDDGYKIIILTNQAGIAKGKTKLADLKAKIERIADALKTPLQAFIAPGDSCFRKPVTGMWHALVTIGNSDVPIDLAQCFYVGDAAGRPENKALKRKKDHSSVDRFLAVNLYTYIHISVFHLISMNNINVFLDKSRHHVLHTRRAFPQGQPNQME